MIIIIYLFLNFYYFIKYGNLLKKLVLALNNKYK